MGLPSSLLPYYLWEQLGGDGGDAGGGRLATSHEGRALICLGTIIIYLLPYLRDYLLFARMFLLFMREYVFYLT